MSVGICQCQDDQGDGYCQVESLLVGEDLHGTGGAWAQGPESNKHGVHLAWRTIERCGRRDEALRSQRPWRYESEQEGGVQ